MKKRYLFYFFNIIIIILFLNFNEYNCINKKGFLNKNNKLNSNLGVYNKKIKNNNNNEIFKLNRTSRSVLVFFLSLIFLSVIFIILQNSIDVATFSRLELNRINDKIANEKCKKIKEILND